MIAASLVCSDGALRCGSEPLDEARVWRVEAENAMRSGDAKLALRCWRVVRQLEPRSLDVMFHVGCCHALVGEPAQAVQAFESLTRVHSAPSALRKRAARLMLLIDPAAN